MRLTLSAREQRTILISGFLGIVVLWVYGTSIVRPLMREAAELNEQARQAHDQLRGLEAVMANEAKVEAQHREASDTVKTLRSLLPAEQELPSVIELLSDLANQSQVKIQTIFPQRPLQDAKAPSSDDATGLAPAEPPVYKDVIVQIDALAGYHELGTFLSLVESGKKPMEVSSLRMSANPREAHRHIIRLLIRLYFATGGSSQTTMTIPTG